MKRPLLLVTLFPLLSSAAQPNILLIVSEDNGPALGYYGNLYARTPQLDRLDTEGVFIVPATS